MALDRDKYTYCWNSRATVALDIVISSNDQALSSSKRIGGSVARKDKGVWRACCVSTDACSGGTLVEGLAVPRNMTSEG